MKKALVPSHKNFEGFDTSFPAQFCARAKQLSASCQRAPRFIGQKNLGTNPFKNFCGRALVFLAILPLVALVSCATTYQREGLFTNGYSDARKSSDTFTVTFRANEQTPPQKVRKYSLKRAAEVTIQNGFRYFVVVEEIGASRNSKNKAHLHYPSIRLVIQCFHEKPQGSDVSEVYDARQLIRG